MTFNFTPGHLAELAVCTSPCLGCDRADAASEATQVPVSFSTHRLLLHFLILLPSTSLLSRCLGPSHLATTACPFIRVAPARTLMWLLTRCQQHPLHNRRPRIPGATAIVHATRHLASLQGLGRSGLRQRSKKYKNAETEAKAGRKSRLFANILHTAMKTSQLNSTQHFKVSVGTISWQYYQVIFYVRYNGLLLTMLSQARHSAVLV